MTEIIITAVIVAAVVITAIIIGSLAVRAARRTINRAETHIVKELFDAATADGIGFDSPPAGPKKISNMNKIYLPLIAKDFPSFNWSDTKRMIEDAVKAHYAGKQAFTIHDTAVSRYEKTGGDIVLLAESSVSYDEGGAKTYAITQTTLSYLRLSGEGTPQTEHALNCPNCSAPLTRNAAGELLCEYCGTLVSGEKTWQITDICQR